MFEPRRLFKWKRDLYEIRTVNVEFQYRGEIKFRKVKAPSGPGGEPRRLTQGSRGIACASTPPRTRASRKHCGCLFPRGSVTPPSHTFASDTHLTHTGHRPSSPRSPPFTKHPIHLSLTTSLQTKTTTSTFPILILQTLLRSKPLISHPRVRSLSLIASSAFSRSRPTCVPSSRTSTRTRSARPRPSAFARSTPIAFP